MPVLSEIVQLLDSWFPPALAADWDNTGLLLGDPARETKKLMTCLTLTPDVAREAVEREVDLVISHHPLMFRPIQKIVANHPQGKVLWSLAGRCAVYSPHTSFDSAATGINQEWCALLDLKEITPLRVDPNLAGLGTGRFGSLSAPCPLREFLERIRTVFRTNHLQYVGDLASPINKVAMSCGAGAELMTDAVRAGCQLMITGEARFHDLLSARDQGFSLVLVGHYASERPAVERLAQRLSDALPETVVTSSQCERDPLQWYL